MEKVENLKKKLSTEIQKAKWELLDEHNQRGAVFFVDSSIDLLEAAVSVALDDVDKVRSWMENKSLARPVNEEVNSLKQDKTTEYDFIIIQPYVLVHKKTPQ